MTLENLLLKTKNRDVIITVIGLGRVGLPLASVLANSGFKISGIDANQSRLESIKKGVCPFYDPPLQENLEKAISSGNVSVVKNISESNLPDIIFFTVGTPSSDKGTVDYSQLYGALEEISNINIKDKMIILRSTMPPKTTEDIIIPYLENKSSLKCGIDFGLAVCPERILEGKAIKELFELPEIIGGINKISTGIAKEVFLAINPNKEILITTLTGAELAKLFTNIYRYTTFALANEFAVWSEMYGVDGSEIIKLANHNYDRCNIPMPGFAGGPCLSKDGTFLDQNTTFTSIVSTAWKLNESIPQHIINNIKKIGGNLFNKKITVLGLSFKSGSDDLRNSPSIKLTEILKSVGANILIHDPYVKSTSSLDESLKEADIVIIATNHKEFKDIKDKINNSNAKIIYDVWSMYQESDFPHSKYLRFGKSK
jgi:UDP-N-acetyl-D-mannosaminuronic acid dehydrogenase